MQKKRGYDTSLLKKVIDILAGGETLPEKYCDHALSGNYAGFRECHILPDWLLIYRIEKELLIIGFNPNGNAQRPVLRQRRFFIQPDNKK